MTTLYVAMFWFAAGLVVGALFTHIKPFQRKQDTKQAPSGDVGSGPQPGERWALHIDDGPWGAKKYPPVLILDVKDGWVRYQMSASMFSDERKRESDFVSMYKRVTA